MNDYSKYGSRKQYLMGLADQFGLPFGVVLTVANILGPNEDFDGLVTELEDAADSGEFE